METNTIENSILKDTIHKDLQCFLLDWDEDYKLQASKIALFNRTLTERWTDTQRKNFIKKFYHSRGHFCDFLWHLGNFAPDKSSKEIVLENIAEEFNDDRLSHEQLYLAFAMKEGVDLSTEHIDNKFNTNKMREFNAAHIAWMYAHKNWDSKLAAFSAYERLDATDYELLSASLFKNFEEEHLFFKIHRLAKHFDKTYRSLLSAWINNKSLVEEAFSFIATTQLNMWRDLSDETFLSTESA